MSILQSLGKIKEKQAETEVNLDFNVEKPDELSKAANKLSAKYTFDYCSYCFNQCFIYNVNYIFPALLKRLGSSHLYIYQDFYFICHLIVNR